MNINPREAFSIPSALPDVTNEVFDETTLIWLLYEKGKTWIIA